MSRLGTIIRAEIRTRALQVHYVLPRRSTPDFHFGQNLFSKSFQRCCRVDPLHTRSTTLLFSAKVKDFGRLPNSSKSLIFLACLH
jgi:hypothetical protein